MRHEVKGGFSDYEMTLVSFILMEMDTMLQRLLNCQGLRMITWQLKLFEFVESKYENRNLIISSVEINLIINFMINFCDIMQLLITLIHNCINTISYHLIIYIECIFISTLGTKIINTLFSLSIKYSIFHTHTHIYLFIFSG